MAIHALDLAPFWTRLVMGFAAGALTWIVAADIGCDIVQRWIRIPHPAARLGVGAATGYALIGCVVGLLGAAHAIHAFFLWMLLVAVLLARTPRLLERLRTLPAGWTQAREALRRADLGIRLALIVKVFAEATGLIIAALPAVWWDPIAYHLPIAAAAVGHGGFVFDPQMAQSGFPLLGEAAALPAYALAGSAGAAMVTLGAGMCVALVVWALADMISAGTGPIAGMLVVTSGVWLWLAPSFYVDVPFATFVVAAIFVALQPNVDEFPFAIPVLAGALSGAAAATKYSGLVLTLVILVLVLRNVGATRHAVLGFIAGFAAVAAGWYVRTFVLTGDPAYPFLSGGLAKSSQVRDFAAHYIDMTRHWCGGGTSVADLVAVPYRLFADPRQFCGDPGLALRIGVIFAIAALFAFSRARLVAIVCAVFALFWFASSQQWRFMLPALFLYAALVAAGSAATSQRLRQASAIVLAALGAFVVFTNWVPQLRSQASSSIVPAFQYISGAQSAAEYLDARLETFAAARWLAQHNIPGEHVVALDDVRDYYFPPGTVWGNPYYQQAIALDWHAPSRLRYQVLIDRGLHYMVVNANDAYVHRTPTGIDWNVLSSDHRHTIHELFSANGVTIYALNGER